MNTSTKRNTLRSLLLLHFVGLILILGSRFAIFVIDQATGGGALPTLALGRDLGGELARRLTLPGFLLTIVTGIIMVFLRYGRRPPVWIWIKSGLTTIALGTAAPLVAPALRAARMWAHWSVEHGSLAPQFHEAAARASLFGGIVFLLVLLNLPVAIWKPFLSVKLNKTPEPKSPLALDSLKRPLQEGSAP
jgi:hypothetical protein